MNTIRQPAVAGLFYPAHARQLTADIESYLSSAHSTGIRPKALIVPHAGYVYSGPIAASAYQCLRSQHAQIKRVVLLGPAHRVAFSGLAAPATTEFITPLGSIVIDQVAIADISLLPQVQVSDLAHEQEHSLEVQLPFLQTLLDSFELVPLVVGDANRRDVAEVLERLWGEEDTLIVISSDLSHYLDYSAAQAMDRATSHAIENLQPELIKYEMACGRNPVNGLLELARKKHLHAHLLDLRNSGDTAGTKDRVVGYGAYAFD
ncbi:MAG: AmmeMemoRadiSam system protein B [Gammaproteobacteria bacterium]|nr:AmmeMemoRadiSam system protein B [Gammaproteobacteria bacterium]